MCFHFSTAFSAEKLELRYDLKISADLPSDVLPRWHVNGFSFPRCLAIIKDNSKKFKILGWGLIPSWIKSREDAMRIRSSTLNARCETVFEKPSFRSAVQKRRCLIPADGFYEWMDFGKQKYPHFITLSDQQIFSLGAISEDWVCKETGEIFRTFSIITVPANSLMERIHNTKKRMPLILDESNENRWLQDDLKKDEIIEMMRPYPDEKMKAITVSRLISSKGANTNTPEVQHYYEYPELVLS